MKKDCTIFFDLKHIHCGRVKVTNDKRRKPGYDIDAAIAHLIANSKATSQGACARFVRQAIEAGGLSTNGRPNYAKNYDAYLPTIGFLEVQIEEYTAIAGDIIVLQNVEGGHIAGHIAMYTGEQWISDFKQRDRWGGSRYRNAYNNNKLIYNYYRWPWI